MIFNTLNSYFIIKNKSFNNLVVLDCFCGTGAIGLELLSRGSKEIIFVDDSLESINLTKRNFSLLNTKQKVTFLNIDYRKIKFNKPKINFFYIDPPYKRINITNVLVSFLGGKILKKEFFGVIELSVDTQLKNLEGFEIWEKKKVSKSSFYFVKNSTDLFSSK